MSLDNQIEAELWDLCWLQKNNEFSDEQAKRIEELVISNAAAREYYVSFHALYANVEWELSELNIQPEKINVQTKVVNAEQLKHHSSVLGFLSSGFIQTREFLLRPMQLSIISSALVLSVGLFVLGQIYLKQQQPSTASNLSELNLAKQKQVAVVLNSRNCVWEQSIHSKVVGDPIFTGETLKIKSGWVDLQFKNQAIVRLQNKSELNISGPTRIELLFGRITALVPATAKGFTVDTKAAEIIDLGTEFGIDVNHEMTSFIRVYQGKVQVSRDQQGSRKFQKILVAGESLTVRNSGQIVNDIRQDKEFTRVKTPAMKKGELLLADNFSTTRDVQFNERNFHNKSIDGRIAKRNSVFFNTRGDCRLIEFHDTKHRGLLQLKNNSQYSPEFNFNTAEIKKAGGYVVEFEMKLTGDTFQRIDHWLGLRMAVANNQRFTSWRSKHGVRLHFRSNGMYSLYEFGKRFRSDGSRSRFSEKETGWQKIRLEVHLNKFNRQSPVKIVGYSNDSKKSFMRYTSSVGFENNYLAFEYVDGRGGVPGSLLIDKIQVSLLRSIDENVSSNKSKNKENIPKE